MAHRLSIIKINVNTQHDLQQHWSLKLDTYIMTIYGHDNMTLYTLSYGHLPRIKHSESLYKYSCELKLLLLF